MKLGDQMRAIQSAMSKIATAENGGKALIAFDQVHLWEQLLYAPGTLKIVCVWDGDVPRTNFPGGSMTGRVDRHFSVVMSRGRGLQHNRGRSLTDGTGNARALYDIAEDVFQACRLLNIQEHDEGPIDYLGSKATDAPEGLVVDAYQVMFSAGTQIGTATLIDAPDPTTSFPPFVPQDDQAITDEMGNPITDESGNPIIAVTTPATQFMTDENGNLITDENGNPITIP